MMALWLAHDAFLQDPKDAHDKTMFHCEDLRLLDWNQKVAAKEAHADSVREMMAPKILKMITSQGREWGNYCCDPSEMVW